MTHLLFFDTRIIFNTKRKLYNLYRYWNKMELKWKINIVPNLLEIFILTYLLSYFIKYFMMKLIHTYIYIYILYQREIFVPCNYWHVSYSQIYVSVSFQNIFPNIAIRAWFIKAEMYVVHNKHGSYYMKIHRDSLNQCPRAFHLEVERQKRSSVRLERELSNLFVI